MLSGCLQPCLTTILSGLCVCRSSGALLALSEHGPACGSSSRGALLLAVQQAIAFRQNSSQRVCQRRFEKNRLSDGTVHESIMMAYDVHEEMRKAWPDVPGYK